MKAKRNEKRLRFGLVPMVMWEAIAERFTIGADKYGDHNWQNGDSKFFEEALDHAQHHLLCFREGILEDEKRLVDHLKAALWNIGVVLWAIAKGKYGNKNRNH